MPTTNAAAEKAATKKATGRSRTTSAGRNGATPTTSPEPNESLAVHLSLGDDPTAKAAPTKDGRAAARGGANQYGAFSIENFASAGALTYTHEDAAGFYNYVKQFAAPNFWYQDANVQVWAFKEDLDNWNDTYGADAVNAMYYSGHGGRRPDGRVWFPLGGNWSGQGTNAWSDEMRLGNEHVNYLFWSTCFSCPVYAPLNPMITWKPANLGFRMLFGYETTSVDNPNYGKFFFEEFNKGKSFSTAWLDASWRISHSQVPSVVACGATQAEATARVNNENRFEWGHVNPAWWQWRFYNAGRNAPKNMTARERNVALPGELSVARLRPVTLDPRAVRATVDRFGVQLAGTREVTVNPTGLFRIGQGDTRVAMASDGSVDVQLEHHDYLNRSQIPDHEAASIAQQALSSYGLSADAALVFDKVRYAYEGGGTTAGSGELLEAVVTGTTVQFKQHINGLPVVNPGAGDVRVTVDNDGKVTHISDSTRTVEQLTRGGSPTPDPDGTERRSPAGTDDDGIEQRLGASWARQLAGWAVKGQMPAGYAVVPETTEIGYSIQNDQAVPVATREVEVDFGQGLFKRYRIEAPLT